MIRQAHSYLVGAVSGTALVAAAIVGFVLLVSAQALRDWPIGGLDLGGGDTSAVQAPLPVTRGLGGPVSASGRATAPNAAGGPGRAEGGTASVPAEVIDSARTPEGSPGANSPGDTGGGSSNGNGPSGSANSGEGSSGTGSGGNGSPSSSRPVTGAVNDVVSGVEGAVGGALEESGVTKATEGTVTEAAGPNSVVGQTADGVDETVGGLLEGNR